jgi:peptidoglycan/LPS O-acetylase OafA/YrhL
MTSLCPDTVLESSLGRRRDLDVMRALVVLGLVVFHSARIFSLEPFYVSNDEESLWLSAFVAWGVVWGMPLMFLIAGQTAGFSLAGRGATAFLAERFKRLMVPFLFGMLVLVPPSTSSSASLWSLCRCSCTCGGRQGGSRSGAQRPFSSGPVPFCCWGFPWG